MTFASLDNVFGSQISQQNKLLNNRR